MITGLYRIWKFALINYARNLWLTFVTVFTIVVTLVLISMAIIFNGAFDHVIGQFHEKLDVSVYLKTDTAPEQVSVLKEILEKSSTVKQVDEITPDDALAHFKEEFKDNETILSALDTLGENPLGTTFVVTLVDKDKYTELNTIIRGDNFAPFIYLDTSNQDDYERLRERIIVLSNTITNISFIIVLAFIVYSLIVLANTIKIGVYSQREEIGIMRLVGADAWFVKVPFILQSVLYSVTAIIIVVPIVYFAGSFLQSMFHGFLSGYNFDIIVFINQNFGLIFGGQLFVSIAVNIVTSSFAVSKYIK